MHKLLFLVTFFVLAWAGSDATELINGSCLDPNGCSSGGGGG